MSLQHDAGRILGQLRQIGVFTNQPTQHNHHIKMPGNLRHDFEVPLPAHPPHQDFLMGHHRHDLNPRVVHQRKAWPKRRARLDQLPGSAVELAE